MDKILQNKTVVLGVTGSIAAYKIANLASMLVKKRGKGSRYYDEKCHKFY